LNYTRIFYRLYIVSYRGGFVNTFF